MIYKALFLSKRMFNDVLEVEPNMVLISIVAQDEFPALTDRPFADILKMNFHDVSEESLGLTVGSIPDASATQKLTISGKVLPDYNDAIAIIEFLNKYSEDVFNYTLVCHCEGGVSRSAAIVKFTSLIYKARIAGFDNDTSLANPRLMRLLFKALAKEVPVIGELN
jgi:predicted protein tyrosine phosphatase